MIYFTAGASSGVSPDLSDFLPALLSDLSSTSILGIVFSSTVYVLGSISWSSFVGGLFVGPVNAARISSSFFWTTLLWDGETSPTFSSTITSSSIGVFYISEGLCGVVYSIFNLTPIDFFFPKLSRVVVL